MIKPLDALELSEYYLWRKSVDTTYPWERQFINSEFLKYEHKRLHDLELWYKRFEKASGGNVVEDVSFFVVPAELTSPWKAAIEESGDYNYFGLSALYNSPQTMLIGLISRDVKQPEEFRLIQITNPKRKDIINRKQNGLVRPSLLIETWNYLKSDCIYVDVPYEKTIVHKMLSENLFVDASIAESFQAPILSAPYSDGAIGGVALASLTQESTFAMELVKTILLMVPPEYRTLSPPKSVRNGVKFPLSDGIKFHLAERPYQDNIFSGKVFKSYEWVTQEISRRQRFPGEYSIFSTINPVVENFTQMWKALLLNFTRTEVTLPVNLDELQHSDVYLSPMKHAINEDLWIQIVHARQHQPGMNPEVAEAFLESEKLLMADYDVHLSESIPGDTKREHLVRSLLHQSSYNLKRVAQSFARADDKERLEGIYFKRARDLIVENFKGFANHPDFRRIVSAMKTKKDDARYSVVQTEIMTHPRSSTADIYKNIQYLRLFGDMYDLQSLLDWMERKGDITVDYLKRYTWIGRTPG